VSALDLSIQAQVLNYMKDVQEEMGLSYIFISHDLGVVKHMCETLAIMHNSRFVEVGERNDIYKNARHIYTRRLIASIPDTNPDMKTVNEMKRIEISKEYHDQYSNYYMEGGKVYPLKKIDEREAHYVAIP